MATGTSILATYSYLNIDGERIKVFPYARWVPIMAILLMYLAFACGIGSIPYALQVKMFLKMCWISTTNSFQIKAELLPVHVRSFGSGLLGVIDNLSLFTATKTAPALNELIGIHGSFYFYTGITVACAIILYLTLPDTTGMSLEEIEDMFRPSHKKKLSQ